MEDAVTSSYQPDPNAQNKSLLIDLSRFWEILEYSFNSDATSARRMFGDTLYLGPPTFAAEVSQTSPLPAPTRLNLLGQLRSQEDTGFGSGPDSPVPQYTVDALASPRHMDLINDEFSILATNFFSQGQDFLRSYDTREGVGDF